MPYRRCSRTCLLVPVLALLTLGARAQLLNVTENNATPITGAGHSYLTGPGGTIQPATGALNFQLALPVPPSRGFTLPFSIHYESDLWHLTAGGWISDGSVQIGFGGPPIAAPLWEGGWYYPVPQASSVEDGVRGPTQPDQCHWYSDYTFLAPDGSRHALPISPSWGEPAQFCASYPSVLTGRSGRWIGTAGAQGDGLSVANVDGLKITFAGDSLNEFPSSITDRNGNQETIQWSGNGVFTYTDSIGRTAVSSSGFGASGDTIALSGLANPYTITWGTATSSYTVGITSLDASIGCPVPNGTVSGTQSVVTAITLPNGQQYTFSYDPVYGTLSRITLPGGGWVNYTWGLNPQSQYQSFRYWPNGADGGTQQCGYLVDAPAVVARTTSFDGSTAAQELDFTYETAWNENLPGEWVERETDVMVHDHVAGTLHEIHYDYVPITVPPPPNEFGPGGQDAVEQQVAYILTPRARSTSDAAVQDSWLDPYSLSTQITTVNGSGNTFTNSLQAWCYDANGMVIEHDEYDNGRAPAALPACAPSVPTAFSGPDVRRTLISYASFAEGSGIFDRPASVRIVNAGNSSVAAETDFQYDPEGNPLQITRVNGSAPAVSQYTYDSYGNRLHYTDPDGNLTQYSWQCGSAYPAQTTLPDTATGTTTVTHAVQFSYDCASGHLLSRTDVENSTTTSFAYNDALGRPTEVDFPDGGKTTYAYTPNTVETKRLFSGSYWTDAIQHLDGFGRVDRQFTFNDDPNNVDTVDTIFNGQGLPYFISYPYSSTGLSSPKATGNSAATPGDTFLRDELGRLLSVTRSDGPVATDAYNVAYGTNSDTATTTYTDEAGAQSVVARDGLGRVAGAYHLVNGSAYDQTAYVRDILGDLTSVAQGGQTRSFNFDQLGRLLTANNPETGAISYQYDPNGNVTQKTDANGTVVTSQYDALNRERTRSFQPGAGVAATPSIAFDYDIDPTGASTSDAYGRLTRVTEGGIVDAFSEYDAVGRPLTADIIVDGTDYHTRVARDGVGFPTYELLPGSRSLYLNDDYEGRTESIEDGGFGTKYLHYRDYGPDSSPYDQQLGDGLDQGWDYL